VTSILKAGTRKFKTQVSIIVGARMLKW